MLFINTKQFTTILLVILTIVGTTFTSFADVTAVSDRTPEVRDAIVAVVSGVDNASDVTETHLAAITSLNLRGKGITALKSGDLSGLTTLTNLNLYNNELSSLPDGIFEGLTALTTLRLGGNTVNPMVVSVSLEKVGSDQFKAVAPTGAPFDIVVPISAINGSIVDSATTLTIAKGNVESDTLTVTRTAGTTDAVTTNIGTLPSLPQNHYGYTLSKPDTLPLEVIGEVVITPTIDPVDPPITPPVDPPVQEVTAPVFTDGTVAARTVAENTTEDVNIGTPIATTDANNDTLSYILSGIDAASFSIDSSTGQLKTKAALDYETKRFYTATITVSDGNLTDSIAVIIVVIDVNDTDLVSASLPVSDRTPQVRDAIVAAIPGVTDATAVTDVHLAAITSLDLRSDGITELKSGDFSGLTALTNLNLHGNMLTNLPSGIFEGLTSLTTLRLGGNLVDPLPVFVSFQQVGVNQYRVVIPAGAPFDIVLSINDSMMVTIPKGSVASASFTHVGTPSIGALPVLPANHFGYILAKSDVCNRTLQVIEAITDAVPSVTDCRNVSDIQLATITTLNLSGKSITSLDAGDFSGLFSLTTLNLSNNQLTTLPNDIFVGLTSLNHLNLSGNSVSPLPLTVLLQKVGENQIRTVVPTGAPFDMNLQVSVANGSLSVDNIMNPKGSAASNSLTVSRTANTTEPVTVDIKTMPSLPTTHSGYELVKPDGLPLEIFKRINVAPIFTEGASTIRAITENTVADENIGEPVAATDVNNNDTLTYSLGGTDAASFDIDSATGQLKTKASLDYETKSSYSVTINVSDGSLTDTINVTLNVTDVDESPTNNAPEFTDGESTIRSVAENTGSGIDIGNAVSATDADNDALTYSLSGTDADSFSIDSTTGQLRTDASLDYETKSSYSVTIIVSDGSLTDTINVTINVTDVDESPTNNAPEFTDGESTIRSVAENTGSGIDIGNAVSATDADNDALTYSLSGTDTDSFSIDSTTGQLRTDASLDYETKSSYSVTIIVSDGSLTDTINATINVTDVDESPTNNAPEFTDGESTIRSVAENTGSGIDIGNAVSATDADNDALTYSLGGTDASSFSIDSTTGQLRTSAVLDYETKSSYSVTITVSDGNEGSDTISVTINVTDIDETPANSAPEFTDGESTTRSVAENTGSGLDIGSSVSATDADNDTLTYSLGGTDASSFSIDSTSGQLRTDASLDYATKSSYSVSINVSDGSLTDTINVTINVTDVDESPTNNAPEFTDGESTTRSVAENTGSGVDIGDAVSATDADNDALTYSLSDTDADSFSIDTSSGQVSNSAALNYESKSSYSVTVNVSDGNGGTDSISVTINVTDVNEAPMFTDGDSTTRVIAENVAADVNIGSAVSATDPESNSLTYTLGGTDAASFSIDNNSGQVKTKITLDYEKKTTYSVTISVSDGTLTDTITVTINVTNLDETPSNNPPVFTDGTSTTRSVPENTATVSNIGTPIAATDADKNTLVYLLSGTDAASFAIDSTNGQLKTSAALNHEAKTSYNVTVTVSDGSETDSITVTINVTDVNEAPVIAADAKTTLSIAENTPAGVNIGGVLSATDPDDGDTLTYSLGGTDASSFDIVSTSGQLQTKASLDYESKTSYSVTITVSDSTLTDTIDITINVADVDENRAPVFADGDSTTRFVAENTGSGVNIGSVVGATDADSDDLTYTLGGTNASSFSINSTNGQLRTSAALDYESKTSYTVTITVSDGNGGEDEITVTINVTDVDENSAPVFTDGDSTTRSVAENTGSGVNIGSVVGATDADNDDLTYTLGGTNASSFTINSTNGQLRTSAALDYESKTSYTVTITVSDGNGGEDEIKVTINVTDVDENRAPVFTDGESTTRSVAENTGSGVTIGSAVGATDADNDDLTYTLGGTNASSFSINSTNGQLRTSATLDYESKTSYSVTITVSDGNGGEDEIKVTINVTDVDENSAPVFTDGDSTTRSVAENTGSGVNIGSVVGATDADNDDLTYTLGGTNASSFTINSTNGQLRTSAALDYESKTSYTVTITVSDGNGGEDEIKVTINVTDVDENRAPVFTDGESTTRSVAENTGSGVTIGSAVAATDADNDDLTYTLGGTNASSFSINSTNGQLRTSATLDYESKTSYSVTITVSDGKLTDEITVTINITDVDENRAPVFTDGDSTTHSVAENTGSGVNIGSVVGATDADNDDLTYTLSGTNASSFTINSTNGQLRTSAALDYESKTSYTVTITVSDGNGGEDEIKVTINVTDVDENRAPVFTDGESTTRSVAENTGSGVTIGSAVGATDADNDDLTYTLGGTNASSFSINSTNGQLRTSATLDYESKTSYSVTITVSDGKLTDEITVTINITDVDENRAPVFTDGSSTTRSVAENTEAGEDIGSAVGATDADDDSLTYTLGGTDMSSFSIVSTSGQLQTNEALDYETKTSYKVDVTVSDGSGGEDEITVTINITDVDENRAPVFADGDSTTRSVAENTEAGEDIGSAVGATDADDDSLTYTLGGTDMSSFSIVSTSGQLQTNEALDYETKTSYTVDVTVSDGNGGEDEITVTISVTDVTETTVTPVSDRTWQVRNAIVAAINGVDSPDDVTTEHLTSIRSLDLSSKSIGSLQNGDFSGLASLRELDLTFNSISSLPANVFENLSSLTTLNLLANSLSSLPTGVFEDLSSLRTLNLAHNSLSSLPAGVFEGLSSLNLLNLSNNSQNSLTIVVSLKKISEGQFKATVNTGATYKIVLPFSVTNGSISGEATTITVGKGKVESDDTLTVVRTTGTTEAVTVNIGTLPRPDSHFHFGYRPVKSSNLPLEVIPAIGGAPNSIPNVPTVTGLLPNYPNPFNPETWIPYQLAKPSDVSVTIYDIGGNVVRKLDLGHQQIGFYQSRSRAVYWNGRNEFGERVANGIYFYQLQADSVSFLRKMVILK